MKYFNTYYVCLTFLYKKYIFSTPKLVFKKYFKIKKNISYYDIFNLNFFYL